ncbi:MAG: hypothetical protein ACRDBG_11085 [Waterburya sp.]
MYTIQQHTTKNGNLTNQWNLIKEATGDVISRFTSGKMAKACLQELQTLLKPNQNNDSESNQEHNSVSTVQQASESVDSSPIDSDASSSELARRNPDTYSLVSPESSGTSLRDRLVEKTRQIAARKSGGAENQELDSKLPRFLQESVEATNRGMEQVFDGWRASNDGWRASNDGWRASNDGWRKANIIAGAAIGIAASAAGIDVGELRHSDSTRIQKSIRQLDPETIDVVVIN